ncbi:MAG: class I SAM-dependent methyltransferase [Gammaproteobacteria bacterium]|nr:class I SAM-dependent methyltransferase [Gammaproteobacteria bacterium]MBP6053504.1 class I SAM-dependent methyltransferase [Pseudomonadales bacterium]MBK6584613.1 class I SAM-dependent methyltransferase [Gammaproteobacteria bacterium]MBK7170915.1 class I SAM-dependent methyltransferase [Gammaproteobacteria bacterium]MBK7519878.1 class I SAM-dependent methyltransferase [Gammaproteobacteria bacterium]
MANNDQQIEHWNGEAGQRWAEHDSALEKTLAPVTAALLSKVTVHQDIQVLDIGCGCGNQSVALARHIGPRGHLTGIDVSAPMLAQARARTARPDSTRAGLSFVQADAAIHDFGDARFDLLFSRFGVMFFADPLAAFRNLHRACAPRARMLFCCWQSSTLNDWIRLPMQAALRHVPAPPAPDPDAPGPFAFADRARVTTLLQDAGFSDIDLQPLQLDLCFAEAPTLAEAVAMLLQVGPVGTLLAAHDDATRARAHEDICSALGHHYSNGKLLLPGAIWLVTGTRGQA